MASASSSSPRGTLVVVGSGGREHAIVWACSTSPLVERIVVAPGNAGTSGTINGCPVESAPATSVPDIVALCTSIKPILVIVGPEVPLSEGLAGKYTSELGTLPLLLKFIENCLRFSVPPIRPRCRRPER